MKKYTPLGSYLADQNATEVPMTFGEIERVIGAKLPPKAQQDRGWWSNNPSNNVLTKVWLEAGFRSERVDIASKRLVFRRLRPPSGWPTAPSPEGRVSGKEFLERVQAALGGSIHFAPDFDPTEPTGEIWDAEIE